MDFISGEDNSGISWQGICLYGSSASMAMPIGLVLSGAFADKMEPITGFSLQMSFVHGRYGLLIESAVVFFLSLAFRKDQSC